MKKQTGKFIDNVHKFEVSFFTQNGIERKTEDGFVKRKQTTL